MYRSPTFRLELKQLFRLLVGHQAGLGCSVVAVHARFGEIALRRHASSGAKMNHDSMYGADRRLSPSTAVVTGTVYRLVVRKGENSLLTVETPWLSQQSHITGTVQASHIRAGSRKLQCDFRIKYPCECVTTEHH
jgi:hypothetical protein